MRPAIKGCIPNGMQVLRMDTFSTERYSLTGINNTLMFEEQLKYDLYSCRKGRGTHFGIQRMAGFLRQCSENYTKDCYVLKLDISGYFMSINKYLLWAKLQAMLRSLSPLRYVRDDTSHYGAGNDRHSEWNEVE